MLCAPPVLPSSRSSLDRLSPDADEELVRIIASLPSTSKKLSWQPSRRKKLSMTGRQLFGKSIVGPPDTGVPPSLQLLPFAHPKPAKRRDKRVCGICITFFVLETNSVHAFTSVDLKKGNKGNQTNSMPRSVGRRFGLISHLNDNATAYHHARKIYASNSCSI